MTDPVNRTILLLDIERYSDRDDVEQAYLRRMLYDITDRTLTVAGVDETSRQRADRGDSVMELIEASSSVPALLRTLLTEVPAQLRTVNRMTSSSAQIRLRGVLASGYVAIDERDGWVGSDLNHACRLLDATVLRAALRERGDGFALCVSDSVYQGIVRHDHYGVPAAEFHRVELDSKNGTLTAYLHGPVPRVPGTAASGPAAPARAGAAAPDTASTPPGASYHFSGGSQSFGGSLVNGDQNILSGGTVTGDVVLGTKKTEDKT
ncbi:hypothetical protein ACFXI8_19770 [Streptomyces niveus]|uniref:hypothetical protein n=1 Tax=Streptomyces niveus TaxID=193462 RepID=UPI0036881CE4